MQWALGKTGTEPEKDLEGNQKRTWKGNFFSPFRHRSVRKAIPNFSPSILCSFRSWSRRTVFAKTCHSSYLLSFQAPNNVPRCAVTLQISLHITLGPFRNEIKESVEANQPVD